MSKNSTLNLKRIGHATLRVSSMENSLEFYCSLLGFELVEGGVRSAQTEKHEGMAFLTLGEKGHDLDLLEVDTLNLSEAKSSTLHHIAFQVDCDEDLQEAYYQLCDKDVPIIKATDHANQKSIYVNDPDGNIIEIFFEHKQSLTMFRQGRGDKEIPLKFSPRDTAS